nr:PREDICTED: trihelix transcription factor GTL1-like [Linepithema humile]
MLLISLYKDHLTLFKNDKIRNEVVWKKIADCLKEKGYIYTAKQTENKWKNLRKSYIKTKDHNSKSGASFKKCKYYDEMEEIYGKSHIVQPVAIASNLSQKIVSISTDEEQRSDRENEDIVPPPKKTKMEKQLHVLTEYMDKNEKAKEKRHKERLEYQKEAIETYKQLMSKLLDKL